MNFIKCPHCGQEDPAFDYAHVCPKTFKYKNNWVEATPEEEEAWKDLEDRLQSNTQVSNPTQDK